MGKQLNLELYAVTDRSWLNGSQLEDQVEQAVLGGATLVQLREKSLSTREFIDTAERIKAITDRYSIPLIINDRLDIALAIDAAGLHVGQDDMSAVAARHLLGPEKILGVSAANLAEAVQAEKDGADYIGAGAVFPTATKKDVGYVNDLELRRITYAVKIPVVAIGGINETNALALKGSGIRGIAVVSALFSKKDVKKASETMRKLADILITEAKAE